MRLISIISLLALAFWPRLAANTPVDPFHILAYGPSTPTSGWILARNRLFLTQDEGETWQAAGPEAQGREFLAADFVGDGAGWLVAVSAESGEQGDLVLATTTDFGANWRWLPLPLFDGDRLEAPLAELELDFESPREGTLRARHSTSSNFERWSEWHTADGGETWARAGREVVAPGRGEGAGDQETVFLSNGQDGWRLERTGRCTLRGSDRVCREETVLQATHDGGRTWGAVPLPDGIGGQRQTVIAGGAGAVAAAVSGGRVMTALGQGFDKCEVATLDQLREWWRESPYSAVNLYIGGSLRACSNRALTADYAVKIYDMGWSFIPTWVGPQAPCTDYRSVISYDSATAQSQGWQEAQAAADTLTRLGLTEPDGTGSIAYYDMEAYDTNNGACNAAVRSFVTGWTQGMHARGHLAGVYGLGPTLSLFASLPQPPDAIWAAHWIYSSYNPGASVWNVYRLSNDLWVNQQRLRQYAGGHNEKWGQLTLNIDSNVLDGPVALAGSAPRPVKPTFTPTPTATPIETSTPVVTATPTPTRTPYPFTPSDWFYLPLLMQR